MEGEGISVALTPSASLSPSSCTVQRVRTIAYARCRHCAHRRSCVTAPRRIPTVFCIQTSIRSVSASEKVYWVQIFQGKSECLLEQKAKGRGEWKSCEVRKEEDAGDSGVHKMCQKKILLLFLPPRPLYKYIYIYIFLSWGSLFLSCDFCSPPISRACEEKISAVLFAYQMQRHSMHMPSFSFIKCFILSRSVEVSVVRHGQEKRRSVLPPCI